MSVQGRQSLRGADGECATVLSQTAPRIESRQPGHKSARPHTPGVAARVCSGEVVQFVSEELRNPPETKVGKSGFEKLTSDVLKALCASAALGEPPFTAKVRCKPFLPTQNGHGASCKRCRSPSRRTLADTGPSMDAGSAPYSRRPGPASWRVTNKLHRPVTHRQADCPIRGRFLFVIASRRRFRSRVGCRGLPLSHVSVSNLRVSALCRRRK